MAEAILIPLIGAAATAALPSFATVATVGSTLLGVTSSIQQSNAVQAAGKANEQIARQNAELAASQTEADVEKQRRAAYMRQGAAAAVAGSRGLGSGSAYDILSDNAAQEELDILTIKHQGQLKKNAYLQNAALEKAGVKAARKQLPYTIGSQILGGASKFGGSANKLAQINALSQGYS